MNAAARPGPFARRSAVGRRGFIGKLLAGGLAGAVNEVGDAVVRVKRGAAAFKVPRGGHDPCLTPRGPRRFGPRMATSR